MAHDANNRARSKGYADLSTRPLHMLVFLAPLIGFYELGAALWLRDGIIEAIGAERVITAFFETFGVVGRHFPAAALVTVLLVWHFIRGDSWKLRPSVLGAMAMESVVWVLPVLVLGLLLPRESALAGADQVALHGLPWRSRAVIAVGAGLYEELLFRMILIAAIHLVVADVLRTPQRFARPAAVIGAAVLFTLYHDLSGPTGVSIALAAFYLISGVYFGVLYLTRGLAVVAAAHALYDLVALQLPG